VVGEIGENIEGENVLKDSIKDSLIKETEIDAYYKWVDVFMEALGVGADESNKFMQGISTANDYYSAFAEVYNEWRDRSKTLDSKLFSPISEYMNEVGWILKAAEIQALNVNQYAQLLSLKCNHEAINEKLDMLISSATSQKTKKLYQSIKDDVNGNFVAEILKIKGNNACKLLPDLISLGVEHGVKFYEVAKGASKMALFAHTATTIVCGYMLEGDALYDAVSDIEKWSYCRKLLAPEVKELLETYKRNPNKENTSLLKVLLRPLANVVKLELEAALKLQESYLFRGEAGKDFEQMTQSSINRIKGFISELE